MDLFDHQLNAAPLNVLPIEGEAYYYGAVVRQELADQYLERVLSEIAWENDQLFIFGREIITKRKVAWYAEQPFSYTYSNTTKTARAWTPVLLDLKAVAERASGETYNACLLNLYHDGGEGMTWHSDDEVDLQKNGAIASLSFGAERRFSFKHKSTKQRISLNLHHGSLLVMRGETQTHWLHQLPPTKKVKSARVNLTFRTIVGYGDRNVQ